MRIKTNFRRKIIISYLVCHMEKYHKQDVAPIEKENERDEKYEASNPQIDSERTKNNYRFTPYLSVYGGGSYVKTETYNNKKSYGYQVGLKGQLPLTDRLQGFASVGVGDDINTYEIGVGYDITSDWDAHIKYRDSKVDVDNYDDNVKGWQVGMGYKF